MLERDVTLMLDDAEGQGVIEVDAFHQVMINASPFFQAMLQSGFAEGEALRKEKKVRIPLPETNVRAIRVLCDILHNESSKVPLGDMTANLLSEVATLVDRYDCAQAIQPWPAAWLTQPSLAAEVKNVEAMNLNQIVIWIHICSQMGEAGLFNDLTCSFVRRVSSKDLENTLFKSLFDKLSSKLQDGLMAQRQKYIDRLYELAMATVTKCEESKGCSYANGGYTTINSDDIFNCCSIQLGNAILALNGTFGFSWREREAWYGSLVGLVWSMRRFANKLSGPRAISGSISRSHWTCVQTESLLKKIESVCDEDTLGLQLNEYGNAFYKNQPNVTRRTRSQTQLLLHSDSAGSASVGFFTSPSRQSEPLVSSFGYSFPRNNNNNHS